MIQTIKSCAGVFCRRLCILIAVIVSLTSITSAQAVSNEEENILTLSREGDVKKVEKFLDDGGEIDLKNEDGMTAFQLALWGNHIHTASFLLEHSADPLVTDKQGANALQFLIRSKLFNVGFYGFNTFEMSLMANQKGQSTEPYASTVEMAKFLLEKGVSVNWKDKTGRTPLHDAAMFNNPELLNLFISNGADINAEDKHQHTALYEAVYRKHDKLVPVLLKHGAEIEPEIVDRAIRSNAFDITKILTQHGAQLHYRHLVSAVRLPDKKMAEFLISQGVPINPQEKEVEYTALTEAISSGSIETAKLLIKKGANVNYALKNGVTPLHRAAERGNLPLVKMLIEQGAALDARTNNGSTSLVYAINARQTEIAVFLIGKNADIHMTNKGGSTLLHIAAIRNQDAVAKLLIKKGVPVDQRDKHGRTPLLIAAEYGASATLETLIENGANINAVNREGKTALELAQENGSTGVAYILKNHEGRTKQND